MKPIKHVLLILAPMLCFLASCSSCKKDKCKGIICYNNGTCHEGGCTCVTGYEGTNCGTASRQKFLGNWSATEQLTTGEVTHSYTVSISEGSDGVNSVVITNLLNSTALSPIQGTITNGTTLYIPAQQLAGNMVYGNGTFGSNTLTVNMSVRDLGTGVTNNSTYVLYK